MRNEAEQHDLVALADHPLEDERLRILTSISSSTAGISASGTTTSVGTIEGPMRLRRIGAKRCSHSCSADSASSSVPPFAATICGKRPRRSPRGATPGTR